MPLLAGIQPNNPVFDNAPVINAYLAELGTPGVVPSELPPGNITINSPIVVPQQGARLRGSGQLRAQGLLAPPAPGPPTIIVPGATFAGSSLLQAAGPGVVLNALTLFPGAQVAQGLELLNNETDVEMTSLSVYGGTTACLTNDGAGDGRLHITNCYFNNEANANNGLCLNLNGPDVIMTGIVTKGGGNAGGGSVDLVATGCHFTGGGSVGTPAPIWKVAPGNAQSARFTGCFFDSYTSGPGMLQMNAGGYLHLTGCTFYQNGGATGQPLINKSNAGGSYILTGCHVDIPSGTFTLISDKGAVGDSIVNLTVPAAAFSAATAGTLATFFGNATAPGRVIGFFYNGAWQPEVT